MARRAARPSTRRGGRRRRDAGGGARPDAGRGGVVITSGGAVITSGGAVITSGGAVVTSRGAVVTHGAKGESFALDLSVSVRQVSSQLPAQVMPTEGGSCRTPDSCIPFTVTTEDYTGAGCD